VVKPGRLDAPRGDLSIGASVEIEPIRDEKLSGEPADPQRLDDGRKPNARYFGGDAAAVAKAQISGASSLLDAQAKSLESIGARIYHGHLDEPGPELGKLKAQLEKTTKELRAAIEAGKGQDGKPVIESYGRLLSSLERGAIETYHFLITEPDGAGGARFKAPGSDLGSGPRWKELVGSNDGLDALTVASAKWEKADGKLRAVLEQVLQLVALGEDVAKLADSSASNGSKVRDRLKALAASDGFGSAPKNPELSKVSTPSTPASEMTRARKVLFHHSSANEVIAALEELDADFKGKVKISASDDPNVSPPYTALRLLVTGDPKEVERYLEALEKSKAGPHAQMVSVHHGKALW
jgi:hypothetical protein